jgi:tyrosine-specific transport protein
LVGYAKIYFGKWGEKITTITSVLAREGALLAYIIVSGHFLRALFGGSAFFWSIAFFVFGALMILFGLRTVAQAELFMVFFLLLTMVIIFVFSVPQINFDNLKTIDFSNLFLPYGVVLFALGGTVAIPEMSEILKGRKLKKAIILGTLVPVLLFVVFTFVVLGVTGTRTTEEALVGLQMVLGIRVMFIGLVFGVLALLTSFLTLGLNVKKILWYDLKIPKHLAWFLSCGIPFFIYLVGVRDFIKVIALIGAVFGGINGIIIALMYLKLKKRWLLSGAVILVFALGIFYEIVKFIGYQ